jgi:hypothetical protein
VAEKANDRRKPFPPKRLPAHGSHGKQKLGEKADMPMAMLFADYRARLSRNQGARRSRHGGNTE